MIFFDIDDTLLDFKGAEYLGVVAFHAKYGEPFNLEIGEFYEQWCKISSKHFKLFLQGHLSFEQQKAERVKDIFKLANISLKENEASKIFEFYLESFEENWRPFDDVIPCLEKLCAKRLGVLSNGDSQQQRMKLEKLGIDGYFELVITARDIGVAKPDPDFFRIACDTAKTSPNDCIFIGDDLEVDILACQKINMRGIWLNRKDKPQIQNTVESITKLSELNNILG